MKISSPSRQCENFGFFGEMPALWQRGCNVAVVSNGRIAVKICEAINNRKLLQFSYDGYPRTVEPHTAGVDKKGHEALRAYQICGGSESGEYVGWKLFHVNEMRNVMVLPDQFAGPRARYKRNDSGFSFIQCQL